MENNIQELTHSRKEELLKRECERKQQIDKMKEGRDVSGREQIDYFSDTFQKKSEEIENGLKQIEQSEIENKSLPDVFDKWCHEIQILNKFVSVSTLFLNNYTIRKCMEKINGLEMKVKKLEEELLPKKKFGFKTRKSNKIEKKLVDEVDRGIKTVVKFEIISCGFTEKKNEKLCLSNEAVSRKDVELSKLNNCTIIIYGSPSTLHITDVCDCKLLCGPVSTSVFIENCSGCTFAFACQQTRIHSTYNCDFYVHVTSRSIIEDTNNVRFAPYNWKYDQLQSDYEVSGLDINRNNWNVVDDFNWLVCDVASPNWSIINEHERINNKSSV